MTIQILVDAPTFSNRPTLDSNGDLTTGDITAILPKLRFSATVEASFEPTLPESLPFKSGTLYFAEEYVS